MPKVPPLATERAASALVEPIVLLVVYEALDPIARVPTPDETPLIVPETDEPLFSVSVPPLLMLAFPVIALFAAIASEPEVPLPTVTVVALMVSLAVIFAPLPILISASAFVAPKVPVESKVLVPAKVTVPTPLEAPLTAPTKVPVPPKAKVDPLPTLILLTSKLALVAVTVFPAVIATLESEFEEVPKVAAVVTSSVKLTVPTPSDPP